MESVWSIYINQHKDRTSSSPSSSSSPVDDKFYNINIPPLLSASASSAPSQVITTTTTTTTTTTILNNNNNNKKNDYQQKQKPQQQQKKRVYDEIITDSDLNDEDPLSLLSIKRDLRSNDGIIGRSSNCGKSSSSSSSSPPVDIPSLYNDRLGPVQYIAWSNDNIIAFTTNHHGGSTSTQSKYTDIRNSIINQPSLSSSSTTDQQYSTPTTDIYIVRADYPHEYIVIKTNHEQIKYLEWSTQQGPLLLSSDLCNQVCLWRKKDTIDEWECIETLNYSSILLCRFISIKSSYYPIPFPSSTTTTTTTNIDGQDQSTTTTTTTTDNNNIISPMKQNSINPSNEIIVQSLLLITKEGKIILLTYNLIEQKWKEILMRDFEMSPYSTIDCADIVSFKDENILIAIHSKSMGNTISIHQLNYDIYTKFGQLFQSSTIYLNDFIDCDQVIKESKKNQLIDRIFFDNSPNVLNVLRKGMDSSILYRWERKENQVSQHQPIIDLFGQNNTTFWSEWNCTTKKLFGKSSINNNTNSSDNNNLESYKNNISTIYYSNLTSIIWICYYGGEIEAISSTTFEPICKSKLPSTSSSSSSLTTPISSFSSPNGCLIATVTNDGHLHIQSLPCNQLKKTVMSQWLSHLFQLSLLRTTDWWDLLVLLRIYSVSSIINYDTFKYVIAKLSMDCLEPRVPIEQNNDTINSTPDQSQLHQHRKPQQQQQQPLCTNRSTLETIRSTIYRMIIGMEVAFVDSQSKMYIHYMLDTIRSSFQPICEQQSPSEDKENMHFLIEWVVEFTYFFLKNVIYFHLFLLRTEFSCNTPQDPEFQSLEHYYPFQFIEFKKSKSYHPLVSLLFDPNILLSLFELLNYSKAYKEKNPDSSKAKYKEADVKSVLETYTNFISDLMPHLLYKDQDRSLPMVNYFLKNNLNWIMNGGGGGIGSNEANSAIQQTADQNGNPIPLCSNTSQLPHLPFIESVRIQDFIKELNQTISQRIPQQLLREASETHINTSFTQLDLDPPLDGFLDQNPIKPPSTLISTTSSSSSTSPTIIGNNTSPAATTTTSTTVLSSSTATPSTIESGFKYSSKCTEIVGFAYDCITRIPIAPKIEKPIKKCTRCHRMTMVRKTALFWSDRWALACPLCGGKWKLIREHCYPLYIHQQRQLQQQQQQLQQQQQQLQQNSSVPTNGGVTGTNSNPVMIQQ